MKIKFKHNGSPKLVEVTGMKVNQTVRHFVMIFKFKKEIGKYGVVVARKPIRSKVFDIYEDNATTEEEFAEMKRISNEIMKDLAKKDYVNLVAGEPTSLLSEEWEVFAEPSAL